jgi:hypothetical protein
MKEIYIVTKGTYSSYSIYGVFEDKDIADEYAAQISDSYDQGRVEPHKIKTEVDLLLPKNYKRFRVTMDIEGNVKSDSGWGFRDGVRQEEVANYNKKDLPEVDYVKSDFVKGTFISNGLYTFMVDTDMGKEGATKIANERRSQLITENKFPTEGQEVRHLLEV